MQENNNDYAQAFKALSDSNRLKIVEMISSGELCACVILEELQITQPTLSHHMKTLCDSKLVIGRKEGKWTYYSLDDETVQRLQSFIGEIMSEKDSNVQAASLCC